MAARPIGLSGQWAFGPCCRVRPLVPSRLGTLSPAPGQMPPPLPLRLPPLLRMRRLPLLAPLLTLLLRVGLLSRVALVHVLTPPPPPSSSPLRPARPLLPLSLLLSWLTGCLCSFSHVPTSSWRSLVPCASLRSVSSSPPPSRSGTGSLPSSPLGLSLCSRAFIVICSPFARNSLRASQPSSAAMRSCAPPFWSMRPLWTLISPSTASMF